MMEIAELIEIIHLKIRRGKGTDEDIIRLVDQYWSKDGKLLAENDPCEDLVNHGKM